MHSGDAVLIFSNHSLSPALVSQVSSSFECLSFLQTQLLDVLRNYLLKLLCSSVSLDLHLLASKPITHNQAKGIFICGIIRKEEHDKLRKLLILQWGWNGWYFLSQPFFFRAKPTFSRSACYWFSPTTFSEEITLFLLKSPALSEVLNPRARKKKITLSVVLKPVQMQLLFK